MLIRLRYVVREFPLVDLHPNAKNAANAAECANEQGKFGQYHDVLFSRQSQWEGRDNATVIGTCSANNNATVTGVQQYVNDGTGIGLRYEPSTGLIHILV